MSRILKKDNAKKKVNLKKWLIGGMIFLTILAMALYVIITKTGHWLVQDDDFDHVSWVVILDGQTGDMERNDYVAQLVNDGKADSILILGRRVFRDKSNAEYYADDLMRQGNIDSSTVFLARHNDRSTIEEAYTIIPWLKARKADTVLLVTSAPATYRAARIFNILSGPKPHFITADIHHHQFDVDAWYTDREAQKHWLREWAALLHSYYDLLGAGNLTAQDSFYYAPIRSLTEESKMEVVDLSAILKKQEAMAESMAKKAEAEKVAAEKVAAEKAEAEKKEAEKKEAEKAQSEEAAKK